MRKINDKPFLQGKICLLLLVLALILVPIASRTFVQTIFVLVIMYAYLGTSWNIICGFSGLLSLGHAVYFGIGAYVSTILLEQFGVSPWLGMFAGAALATVIGMLIGLPTFRLTGPYFNLASIAFCQLVGTFVKNTEMLGNIRLAGGSGFSLTSHGANFKLFEFVGKLPYYYIILAMLVIVVIISFVISRNKLGYYLVAIRSDQDAARSLGINLTKPRITAMAISCFLMALGGTFYAQYFRYIGPDTVFVHDMSVQIALIALVGGSGTVLGPTLGAIIVIPISEMLAAQFSGKVAGLNLLMYGVALMLVVYFMPHGVCEFVVRWVNKFEAWLFGLFRGKKTEKPAEK